VTTPTQAVAKADRLLQLEGVVKHWHAGDEVVKAVDGVNLSLDRGEFVVIYGPSGSGKTTLLLVAAAILRPDAGIVRLDGCDMSSLSDADASDHQRRVTGFIYQTFDLMPGVPAVDNAAMKLLADRVSLSSARKAAIPWLERVGLGARLSHTPDRLSGGECQRVAIARALVNEPQLILADEPTGNLDTTRGIQILALLNEVRKEREVGVVLVTHDPEAAKLADSVYTLRDGELTPGMTLRTGDHKPEGWRASA
jgi:putative ABC transport system ATP-binding protein